MASLINNSWPETTPGPQRSWAKSRRLLLARDYSQPNFSIEVTSFNNVSDRLAQLTIRINGKYHLNIIHAHLPTSIHEDQDVERVNEDINNIINSKAHYNVIMGDFNVKVGLGYPAKYCIGPYGLGSRNTRGDSLVNFAEKIMNTFLKKRLHRR